MTPALMLAYGNPLRGDDGLGRWMAAKVQEQFASSQVEVLSTHQLTPEMAQPISTSDTVIFLDCSATEAPGHVSLRPVEPATKLPRLMTHHVNPAALIRMSQELYGRIPRLAYLITVGGESFKMEDRLSDTVRGTAPAVLMLVEDIVRAANVLRWNLPGSELAVEDATELSSV